MMYLKENMKKALVVYYSFEGSTEIVAKAISDTYHLDILSIKPVIEIKSKGFTKYIWGGGQVVMGTIPEIESILIDLDEYDFIFIGTPIWAGTFAPPIRALLEDKKLHDKQIAYFYTSLGGASLAEKRAQQAFSINNTLVSTIGLTDVKNNPEPAIKRVLEWSRELIIS